MSTNSSSAPPWLAHVIRFSAFPTTTLDVAACTDWWQRIVGSSPETLTLHQGTTLQAAGPYGQGTLGLGVMAALESRVDLVMGPALPPGSPMPPALTLGPPSDAVHLFREVVMRWLNLRVPVRRVGLSTALLSTVPDRVSGYRVLAELLPQVKIDTDNSSDFIYQINRPIRSGAIDIVVNRLSRWTVMAQVPIQVSVSVPMSGGAPTAQLVPTSQGAHFVRLDLDINTDANYKTELKPDTLPSLLNEMIEVSSKIATEGDKP